MKKKNVILLLFLALLLVFLSGCAARATISGGPTIDVPTSPVSGGSGKLRRIFPPNNIIVVVNGTDSNIILTVYQIYSSGFKVRLEPGGQAELPFRQFMGRGRVVVTASVYDPHSEVIADVASRTFYLTDDGGNVRMYDWIIRKSSSRRLIR